MQANKHTRVDMLQLALAPAFYSPDAFAKAISRVGVDLGFRSRRLQPWGDDANQPMMIVLDVEIRFGSVVGEQINQAVTQMGQVTQQNAAYVSENATSAERLNEQAQTLVDLVAKFILPGDRQGLAA